MHKEKKGEHKEKHEPHHRESIEEQTLHSLVELQKVHLHLAEKFDKLTVQIENLLALFELAARNFAKQPSMQNTEKDKEFLDKIDKLLDQNKIIQPIKEIQKFRPVEIKIIKRQPDIKIINDIKPLENIQKNQNLGTLIKDPYVEEIECVDVQSPLVVKKFGSIQKTQVKLSIEEIYELIAEFSQKSRIPVINGKIRAALNNLIITATLSGSSGPSFIIQKKKY